MKSLARVVALSALCSSVIGLAASPPYADELEESLSCLPAAKPFFHRAWEALSNDHLDEARDLFTQTVAVDPACTMAWAHLGALTPGPNGQKMVEDATAASAGLTEVERLTVLSLAAQHRGDDERALSLVRSAVIYSPRSYMLNFAVAQRAGALRYWPEMAGAAQRATELAPERGAGWNALGYAFVGLKQHEKAAAAFRRYADVAPMEPNAHDSLGDALLATNRLEQARAAYENALESSEGTFWASGHGLATVYALQGDWFSARAAIEKARRMATLEDDRLGLMVWTAWSYLADHQPGEAYRAVDELEQDAVRLGLAKRVVDARLLRARFLLAQGRYNDALNRFIVLGAQRFPTLSETQRQTLEARRLEGMIEAHARLGNVSDAEKALGRLMTVFQARPHDVQSPDAIARARGLIAMQRKTLGEAINSFTQCTENAAVCRLELAEAQERDGDAAAASKTRSLVRVANQRDPEYWWVHVRALERSRDAEPRALREDRSAF